MVGKPRIRTRLGREIHRNLVKSAGPKQALIGHVLQHKNPQEILARIMRGVGKLNVQNKYLGVNILEKDASGNGTGIGVDQGRAVSMRKWSATTISTARSR